MPGQRLGCRRGAAYGQVARTCTDHAPHFANLDGYVGAVLQLADPQRDVDMFVEQVRDPVVQDHPDRDVRVSSKERGDNRQHVQAAEHDRSGDHQLPTRRAEFPGRGTLGIVNLLQDTLAGGHVAAACVGEAQAAGSIGSATARRDVPRDRTPCG